MDVNQTLRQAPALPGSERWVENLGHWASGQRLSNIERWVIGLLREAGCECPLPLFGVRWNDRVRDYQPRCRLCGRTANVVRAEDR